MGGLPETNTWHGRLRSWVERHRFLVLAAIILLGLGLRTLLVQTRNAITHDEVMSYLSATGHLQAYETMVAAKRWPCGTWASAAQWKQFLAIEKLLCFGTIRRDSATMDYHPPLYFWLLHLWTLVTGVGLGTGAALNLILASCTALALYQLAGHVGLDRVCGLVTVWIWLLSPAVMGTSVLVRQYELLALFTVLLVWRLERSAGEGKTGGPKEFLLLALLTAGGVLTHFNYVIVVIGCMVYQLWQYWLQRKTVLLLPVGAMFSGGVVSIIMNPLFYRSFLLLRQHGEEWGIEAFAQRLGRVVSGVMGFIVPERVWVVLASQVSPGVITAALLSVVVILFLCWFGRTRCQRDGVVSCVFGQHVRLSWFMLFWIGIGLIGQYLSCASPPQAMGGRYLSPLWPFVALGLVAGLCTWTGKRTRFVLLAVLCLGLFLGDATKAGHSIVLARRNPSFTEFLEKYDRVVTDRLANGFFLRIIWYLPDDRLVYGESQEDLYSHLAQVSTATGSVLFISEPGGSNTRMERDRILERLRHSGSVDEIDGSYWDLDYVAVYRARPEH